MILVSINDEEGFLVLRRYDSRLNYGLTHAIVIDDQVCLGPEHVKTFRDWPAPRDKVPESAQHKWGWSDV